MSFILQKLFSFRISHLLIVDLSVCATGVIFGKWFPVSLPSRLLLTFSSIRFNVTGFMLRFLIPLDEFCESICSLLHTDIQLCQYHLLNMLSPFHCIILASLSKIRSL